MTTEKRVATLISLLKKSYDFTSSLLYPSATQLTGRDNLHRIVGGWPTLPLRLLPDLSHALFFTAIIYAADQLLYNSALQMIAALRLEEIFTLSILKAEFIAGVTTALRRIALLLLWLPATLRMLRAATRELWLSRHELILLERYPLGVHFSRLPLRSIRRIGYRQLPGERLFTTGTLEIWFGDMERITIALVPQIGRRLALIHKFMNNRPPRK